MRGGETCDDGNSTAGDGCSSRCRLECGDGIRSGSEQCDDGNNVSGDGCTASCVRECADPSNCSDADACTTDECVAGGCAHQPLPGRPGILCAIQKLIDNPPCEGETGTKLGLKLARLLRLLRRADDVANPRPVAQRALRLRTRTEVRRIGWRAAPSCRRAA